MTNFSLSIYSITINKRLKPELEDLQDFDDGKDFLDILDKLFCTWKFENVQKDNIPLYQNKNQEKVFRIAKKSDKSNEYHYKITGRSISGIIETGQYGTEESVVDTLTGKSSYNKKTTDALMVPFYFMINIPENSNKGYLIVERIGNNGIYSLLNEAILNNVKLDEGRYVLKILPFFVEQVMNNNMNGIGGAKKIIFRNINIENASLGNLSNNQVSEEGSTAELSFSIGRNKHFNVGNWVKTLMGKKVDKGYKINDITYGDIAFEMNFQGRQRTISIAHAEVLGTNMDISHKVELGPNGYPKIESIEREANLLLSYIRQNNKSSLV